MRIYLADGITFWGLSDSHAHGILPDFRTTWSILSNLRFFLHHFSEDVFSVTYWLVLVLVSISILDYKQQKLN